MDDRKRLYSLDFIRGFMALAVMVYHLLHYEDVITLYAIGRYAVYAFFVLSGFAMYYVYRDRLSSIQDLKDYFIKRFFRIAPLLYVVIAGVIVLRFLLQLQVFDLEFWQDLLLNYTLLFAFIDPGRTAIAPASWSLGIEWVFYCVFPVALIFTQGSMKRLIIMTVILYVVHLLFIQYTLGSGTHLREQWANYIQPVNFFVYFAFGMVIAELRLRYTPTVFVQYISIGVILISMCIFIFIPQSDSVEILKNWPSTVMFFTAISVVLAGAFLDVQNSFFQGMSKFLGEISYAVYLFHVPAYWLVSWFGMGTVVSIGLTSMLTIIGAILSYSYFERPFQKLGQNMVQKGRD